MKKLTSALVSLMLVLSFTACGNDEQSNNSENSVNDSSTSSSEVPMSRPQRLKVRRLRMR